MSDCLTLLKGIFCSTCGLEKKINLLRDQIVKKSEKWSQDVRCETSLSGAVMTVPTVSFLFMTQLELHCHV